MTLESATQHEDLVGLAREIIAVLEPAASDLAESAGLNLTRITIRLTDCLSEEVQSDRDEGLPAYNTDRVGGEVAGITLRSRKGDENRRVLINAAALAADDQGWGKTYLPATMAHEVAHCLIAECRSQCGNPIGYAPGASDLIATLGSMAVSVCDEYLADEIAKGLMPPAGVSIHSEDEVTTVEDRLVNACAWVARMCDDLDQQMYPSLAQRVQQYRETDADLDGMVLDVIRGVDSCLIASAHFRSSTQPFDGKIEGMDDVAAHPASLLYLEPFWATVGPLLDARIAAGPLVGFAAEDQKTFDTASEAIRRLLTTLGLELERMPDDGIFVHVDDPQVLS
jgi:hypothetical protein